MAVVTADLDRWELLKWAIAEACKWRGDSDEHKATLLQECAALSDSDMDWYREYFILQATMHKEAGRRG